MIDMLLYITSHLNYYHFNSEDALLLKRELQRWTTLSRSEQMAVAQEQNLLQRFQTMFANDPFLEQNGFISVQNITGVLPGDITGAAAEGYFGKDGKCLTLHPKGTQIGDSCADFLSDEILSDFVAEKCTQAKQVQARFSEYCENARKNKETRFTSIRSPEIYVEGEKRKNPSAAKTIICILFYVLFLWYITSVCRMLVSLHSFGIGFAEWPQEVKIVLAVAVAAIIVAVVKFPRYYTLVCCGLYRIWVDLCFKRAEYAQRTKGQKVNASLVPHDWYIKFAEAVVEDRTSIASDPDIPYARLKTTQMLKKTSEATLFGDKYYPDKPWSAFLTAKKEDKAILAGVLIVAMAICLAL